MSAEPSIDPPAVASGPPIVCNPKHKVLADYFLRGRSKTQAAIDAGYSPRTAGVQGAGILKRPDVAAYLAWHRSQSSNETQDIRALIDEELRDLAFANIEDLIRVDEDGLPQVDFSTATRAQLKAVTSVASKLSTRYGKDGEVIGTEKQSRFGFVDKARAVELLGKLHGMFKQDELKVTVDVADRLLQARRRVSLLEDGS